MMPLMDLTDDEFHWLAVAVEAAKEGVERWSIHPNDIDMQLDKGLLIQKYTELQAKFPPPEIG